MLCINWCPRADLMGFLYVLQNQTGKVEGWKASLTQLFSVNIIDDAHPPSRNFVGAQADRIRLGSPNSSPTVEASRKSPQANDWFGSKTPNLDFQNLYERWWTLTWRWAETFRLSTEEENTTELSGSFTLVVAHALEDAQSLNKRLWCFSRGKATARTQEPEKLITQPGSEVEFGNFLMFLMRLLKVTCCLNETMAWKGYHPGFKVQR